jgi:hypothetical protein
MRRKRRNRWKRRRIQWLEPVRFQWRRKNVREIISMRWVLVRCVIWGAVIGIGLHALFALGLNAPVPQQLLVRYYLMAVVAMPGTLISMILLHLVFPRLVTIQPMALILQQGQSARPLMADRILHWRFIVVGQSKSMTALALRYKNRRGGKATIVLGLATKIVLIHLDQRLRLMQRLANYRTMRKERTQPSRTDQLTWTLAPATS